MAVLTASGRGDMSLTVALFAKYQVSGLYCDAASDMPAFHGKYGIWNVLDANFTSANRDCSIGRSRRDANELPVIREDLVGEPAFFLHCLLHGGTFLCIVFPLNCMTQPRGKELRPRMGEEWNKLLT